MIASGSLGRIVDAQFCFLHSSDLDVDKPANWKRQTATCGQIGVMGDLGMHVLHVPLRLGWQPMTVYAQLQDLVPVRPDGRGGMTACDTIDNAMLTCRSVDDTGEFPLSLVTKRIAPGEMNTWSMRVMGMAGGVEFSTRNPQVLRVMTVVAGEQVWQEVQVGSQSSAPTVTGAIFEFGFADALLQMWASYLSERAGALGDGFGCVTPQEAVASHLVFDAALLSSAEDRAITVPSSHGPLRRHGPGDVLGVIGR
jgi:predicted dehydrogenase